MAGTNLGSSLFEGVTPTNSTSGQFVVKYSSACVVLWARGDMRIGNQFVVDRDQTIISAGTFSNVVQFGSTTISNTASSAIYIVKYNTNGAVLWATQLEGLGNDEVAALYADGRGMYWVTGSLALDQGGTRVGQRMFLACFDSAGKLLEYRQASGSGTSAGNGIAFLQGGIMVCGTFTTNVTFLDHSLTNSGDSDIFLIKFTPVPPAIQTTVVPGNIVQTWPDPQSLGFPATDTFVLETSTTLSGWTPSTNPPTVSGGQYTVTNSITNGVQFFRLRR